MRLNKNGNLQGLGRHPKPATVNSLSDIEAAWLGAMLDGEGTIGVYPNGPIAGRLPLGEISVANTEVELIATVLRITGVGHVYARMPKSKPIVPGAPIWRKDLLLYWKCSRQNDVKALVKRLVPYCLKAQKVLEWASSS